MANVRSDRSDPRRPIGFLSVVASDDGKSKTMACPIEELQVSPVSRGPDGAVRIGRVWSEEGVVVIQGVVSPGGSMADHAGEGPLLVVIRSGEGAFTLTSADGTKDEITCSPGDVVLVEARAQHGFRNAGDAPLSFVGVQAMKGAS